MLCENAINLRKKYQQLYRISLCGLHKLLICAILKILDFRHNCKKNHNTCMKFCYFVAKFTNGRVKFNFERRDFMRFIKTDDLKAGMRLAKPIYNRNGVLLYERNSALTMAAISSVKNFGLIGIYILEPAEPLPPLSREDIEFEQLQTIYMFQLRECVDLIIKHQKPEPLYRLLQDIVTHYGSLNHRVNFNQNLRSGEDFMYKHALSTAILTAMMTSRMSYTPLKQLTTVTAALLYDIGYRYVPKQILERGPANMSENDHKVIQQSLERGLSYLSMYRSEYDFFPRALALMQAYVFENHPEKLSFIPDEDLQFMVQILRVADQFDQMTAMNIGYDPVSEIMAMRHLRENPYQYHPNIVTVLADCIHIVPHAASVDLTSGDKGIVLVENNNDCMRPVVLRISDNQIFDLSIDSVYREIQIKDIMKTMDNRIAVDEDTLKQFIPNEELKTLAQKFQSKFRRIHAREEAKAAVPPNAAFSSQA